MDVTIISPVVCEAAHYEAVCRLLRQLTTRCIAFPVEDYQRLLESPCSKLFLLLCEGNVMGMLTVGMYASPTGTKAWIEDVVVDELYRGRSLGRRLVAHAIDVAREQGIDTLEDAAAFIHEQNLRSSRLANLMRLLQIRGRSLTPAEARCAQSWLEMNFSDDVIALAYEKTCLNTGGLNWNYMNKILQRWHEAGLHTAEAVKNGDRKPGGGPRTGQRQLDEEERAAIERMLSEV